MGHRKNRLIRGSVSAKLNILIVTIILIVAGCLIIISNRSYRKAVFYSAEKKLNSIEIPVEEEIVQAMDHFQQIFETEAFQNARAGISPDTRKADGTSSLAIWLQSRPSWRELDLEEHDASNLLIEWLIAAEWIDAFWESNGLYSICAEVQKGGKTWWIYDRTMNEDYGVMPKIEAFGKEESRFPGLSAGSFSTASMTSIGEKKLYIRCLQDELEGGGAYRVWIALDMTDAVSEYYGFLITSLLSVLVLTLLFNGIAVLILRRQVSRPISMMAKATRMFLPEADGTYSANSISKVQVRSEDELGELSRDIRSMQEQIVENTGNLARMTAERERINTEMNLARDIQISALPNVFPERPEFILYASMTPARDVGGDFYDFFPVDEDHLALVIADVSGKGIPAALFMMRAKSLIKNQLMAGSDPAKALEQVNAQLYDGNTSMMFVTVWIAVLELSTGRGTACNAGHENPFLRRGGNGFELLKYQHDRFVGTFRKPQYHNLDFELHAGDCLFVYTDGVPEAINTDRQMFGEERLEDTLNRYADAGPEELIRCVHGEVDRFAGGAEQFDDITMLCLEYHGTEKKAGSTEP